MELHPSVRNIVNRVVTELKGQPLGIASLDESARIPVAQSPPPNLVITTDNQIGQFSDSPYSAVTYADEYERLRDILIDQKMVGDLTVSVSVRRASSGGTGYFKFLYNGVFLNETPVMVSGNWQIWNFQIDRTFMPGDVLSLWGKRGTSEWAEFEDIWIFYRIIDVQQIYASTP